MKLIKLAALALTIGVGSADAAVISFQTGYSAAGSQASAEDYRDVVNAAVAGSPNNTLLSTYDDVSNQSIFGGSNSNIAFKSTITFGLASAGTYWFRAGVDFGNGGAVFLDNTPVAYKSTDMWWNYGYGSTDQFFAINSTALSAGNHTLTIYGLEGCCDGGQQVQYATDGESFHSFSTATLAPVPEPETYAMLLGGLGVVGTLARRRRYKQQA
ncbi:PEP-CTERM sorting domain-containing protein [Duganella sp. FT135W]|uniref:PEP-CTERM sorting domain-containing protein n=1 Tax=Duganella flavida TaxID=2692175 RepID=A0A6L8KF89_9BURK|nr:CCXG family PEP-CTERM protein [Duganella flavida]MYM25680.1 PEP-CTERM sorting domain-containing protein [Duganella flavida]